MSGERWMPIPGYVGIYQVSDQGRVRSLDRMVRLGLSGALRFTPGKTLVPFTIGRGYPGVKLRRDGGRQTIPIHRLVLLAFVGPLPPGHVTRHLDGDETNNRLSNLRYGTASENNYDTVRHGRHYLASRSHCIHGHEYTPENTALARSVHGLRRRCRTCERARGERARARRRAAA